MSVDDAIAYRAVNAGLTLYAAGRYFDAHEAWEWLWRRTDAPQRDALQALIQVAAAAIKRDAGNRDAAARLLDKAAARLDAVVSVVPSVFGIDFVALGAELRARQQSLAAAGNGAEPLATPPQAPALRLPARTGPDGFVYLHGFASGPTSTKAGRIVPALRDAGFSVTVPDLNAGGFRHLTVTRALAQVRRLLRDRTIVIGSSLGGYLAALAAGEDDRVRALVLMAPAFDLAPRLESRHGAAAIAEWRRTGSIAVEHYAYGGLHELDIGFLDDAERHPARPALAVPTYILQGSRDDVVPASTVSDAVRDAPPSVRLDIVDDDHGLVASCERARDAALGFARDLAFAADAAPEDPDSVLADLGIARGR